MTLNIASQRTPGPFCLTDAHGAHLCGPAALHKRSNGNIRRAMREAWEDALRAADLMRGSCTYDADGYLTACTCEVFTVAGEWQARGHGETRRDGFADFGHIISDARGGAYCGGNALPEDNRANEAHGEHAPHISALFPVDAWRAAWRETAMARMTKAKRARVI